MFNFAPNKRKAPDAELDDGLPRRPADLSPAVIENIDKTAASNKRMRVEEPEVEAGEISEKGKGKEKADQNEKPSEPMPRGLFSMFAPRSTPKQKKDRQPRPLPQEGSRSSLRNMGAFKEPPPRPLVPSSHFRPMPATGIRFPQPRSHTNWDPYHPGADILYDPKNNPNPSKPPHMRSKPASFKEKEPPVRPKPSLYKYELGKTYQAWMAPPNYSLSTFEAYQRDAMQNENPFTEGFVAPQPTVPTPRPEGWLSPAQRCTEDILENIFEHLYQIVLETPLPCVPIKGRDPWEGTLTNERLTNGEIRAYKTAIMRKSLYDYGLVCKSWWSGTQKGWNEVVIIGEKDAECALKRVDHWIPVRSTRHLSLTLQMTYPSIHRLLRSFAHAVHRCREKTTVEPILGLETRGDEPAPPKPTEIPIPIRKLTILHAFEPEDLGELRQQLLDDVLAMFAPVEFEIEFYGGEKIIERKSLDTVARAMRWPWGYFGVKDKFRVAISQEDEMGLVNAAQGSTGRAIIERQCETAGERRDREKLERQNRKLGQMKKMPAGEIWVESLDTASEIRARRAGEAQWLSGQNKDEDKRRKDEERRLRELGKKVEQQDMDLVAVPKKKARTGEVPEAEDDEEIAMNGDGPNSDIPQYAPMPDAAVAVDSSAPMEIDGKEANDKPGQPTPTPGKPAKQFKRANFTTAAERKALPGKTPAYTKAMTVKVASTPAPPTTAAPPLAGPSQTPFAAKPGPLKAAPASTRAGKSTSTAPAIDDTTWRKRASEIMRQPLLEVGTVSSKRKRDAEEEEEAQRAEVRIEDEYGSDTESIPGFNYADEFNEFKDSGLNEDSMDIVRPSNLDGPDPWLLAEDEFDPVKSYDDRVAAYIYILEKRTQHLNDPFLIGLKPTERKRREIWADLFGENDDMSREFTKADKKWMQLADRERMPRGWIPPLGWKINNPTGIDVLTRALTTWLECLEKLSVRAHWMNIYHQVKRSSKKGKLVQFDYYFIPLPGKTVAKAVHRRRPHRSPNPPLGALKSLDNILMWDFRERPEKWYRKIMRKRAEAQGMEWDEPPATRKLSWKAHVPFDLWMQQKDRRKFKGQGKGHPWAAKSEEVVLGAIKKVILDEGDKWELPQFAADEGWDNQRYFDEMINFVVNRSTRRKKITYPIYPLRAGNVRDITRGAKVDPEWLAHSLEKTRAGFALEQRKWLEREERWFNEPEEEKDRRKWIEKATERYLVSINDKGRRELMLKLRKKFGARNLWKRCHWDLLHPDYPGVTIQVEVKAE